MKIPRWRSGESGARRFQVLSTGQSFSGVRMQMYQQDRVEQPEPVRFGEIPAGERGQRGE
jgi:hypothetical protein